MVGIFRAFLLVCFFAGYVQGKKLRDKRAGACADAIPNCVDYGISVCTDPTYSGWVTNNCAKFCGKCTVAPSLGIPPTPSSACVDKAPNCASYPSTTCTDPNYSVWVLDNCALFCGKCSSGVHVQTPAAATPSSACVDKAPNCASFPSNICTDPNYSAWVLDNCALFCGKCSSGVHVQTTAAAITTLFTAMSACQDRMATCSALASTANICRDPASRVFAEQSCALTCGLCQSSVQTAGVPFVATLAPASSGCSDTLSNCKDYGQTVCSDPTYTEWVKQNCRQFCNQCVNAQPLAPTQAPATACSDAIPNCKDYGQDVCTNVPYTQWVDKNCRLYCNRCGATTNSLMPATAAPHSINGGSTGCVYMNQVYQQGQVWRDGCKFNCTCVEGNTGKYQCLSLCMDWSNLPQVCSMNPPAPGKCCPKPSCPPGFLINYPPDYVDV